MWWNDCMRACENFQRSGRVGIGSCTKTMHPPTQLWASSSFWQKNKMVPLYPPHSPDQAPCDFVLSPRVKQDLKGKRFVDVAEVQWKLLVALDSISTEDFWQRFQQWEQHWDRCILSQGGTLKGTKVSDLYNLHKFFCNNSWNFWVLARTLNSSARYLTESMHHNYPITVWP